MPPLYNKEFSVNFEPSSFDKFFSSVEYIEHNLEYINKKLNISIYDKWRHNIKKKERENPLFLSHHMGLFLVTA